MGIPDSLLNDLAAVPRDRRVTLILRHSARFPIIPPDLGFGVPLTEEGVRMAEELGVILGQHYAGGRLAAAPVGRCLDTADAIARGAGWPLKAVPDARISHPVLEADWERVRTGSMNGHLPQAVRSALEFLLDQADPLPGLDVMATHDTVVGVLASCLLHAEILGENWPAFLEGLFLWREGEQIHVRWRGEAYCFLRDPQGDFIRVE